MFQFLLFVILFIFSNSLHAVVVNCKSLQDIDGHLKFKLENQKLIIFECKNKQNICHFPELTHENSHVFSTSGSFIFNGSKKEYLIFDDQFYSLEVRTDYALTRSGDMIHSKNISTKFTCSLVEQI